MNIKTSPLLRAVLFQINCRFAAIKKGALAASPPKKKF
jgi:hypothetical protein